MLNKCSQALHLITVSSGFPASFFVVSAVLAAEIRKEAIKNIRTTFSYIEIILDVAVKNFRKSDSIFSKILFELPNINAYNLM